MRRPLAQRADERVVGRNFSQHRQKFACVAAVPALVFPARRIHPDPHGYRMPACMMTARAEPCLCRSSKSLFTIEGSCKAFVLSTAVGEDVADWRCFRRHTLSLPCVTSKYSTSEPSTAQLTSRRRSNRVRPPGEQAACRSREAGASSEARPSGHESTPVEPGPSELQTFEGSNHRRAGVCGDNSNGLSGRSKNSAG